MTLTKETIEWVSSFEELPDTEMKVVVLDDLDDLWLGYHDGAEWWIYADTGLVTVSSDGGGIMAWAALEGPRHA
jgi:hypothetical protein